MTIIPCNKVIDLTNYPKDVESSFKNEKDMSISFFEDVFEFTQIRQIYKGKVGRGDFKMATILRWVHRFRSNLF